MHEPIRPMSADEAIAAAMDCFRAGDIAGAERLYRLAISLRDCGVAAWFGLAQLLHHLGRLNEADECYGRAIALQPDLVEALNNRGTVLRRLGRGDEALNCLRQAQRLRPGSAQIANNLGNLLKEAGELDQAIESYRQAISLQADRRARADAYHNLAHALKDTGDVGKAIPEFDHALELDPAHIAAHSGKLYAMYFDPRFNAEEILQEHRKWNDRHARPLLNIAHPHKIDPTADRKLRIGYVSDDLYFHPVGRFLLPLLKEHDPEQFEVFCYTGVTRSDSMMIDLREASDVWRNTAGVSDEQLASIIRHDQIDILIDLTMHMAGSRLLTFARKPAPVQVTYLAYCGTTGLSAMDWRLSDPYLDPPGWDARYAEKTFRLSSTYWCYEPPDVAATHSPGSGGGVADSITFGCLNAFCKTSQPALCAWSNILHVVPNSRLLLHAGQGAHRQRVLDEFSARGLDRDRIEFIGFLPFAQYLEAHAQIDIALDPFPYTGGTTTCDALWKGTPVITLASQTAVGRGGVSLLTNLGLPEFIAASPKDYERIAIALAGDPARRAALRQELPEKMKRSSMMNATAFARDVEKAYREMWRRYCQVRG